MVNKKILTITIITVILSGIIFLLNSNHIQAQTSTQPNFKVAFIGDSGAGSNFQSVLNLIKAEGANMVLHQGDFDYSAGPSKWMNMVDSTLGSNFPYFGSDGNHDNWDSDGYSRYFTDRIRSLGIAVTPDPGSGTIPASYSITYNGLKMVFSKENGDPTFIDNQLSSDNHTWKVCSWHKNQQYMQVGGKGNSQGWPDYENCRKYGAIIATAHEHTYERTKTLTSMQNITVDTTQHPRDGNDVPQNPNNVLAMPGKTFAFVSGIGGNGIRNQDRCLPTTYPYGGGTGCNYIWASIYTSDQSAKYGALFITFNVDGNPNKARAYFKNINGQVVDQFDITTSSTPTTPGPTTTTPTRTPTPTTPGPSLTPTPPITPGVQSPFHGAPASIPGTIQAEDFDYGGEGVAYHDFDPTNRGNSAYRSGEGVDVNTTPDTGGGYHVGWVENSEWLEYSVNVASTGNYTIQVRVSHGGGSTGGNFHVEFDGQNVTSSMTVPNTGSWNSFQNVQKQVYLTKGNHIMRVHMDSLGGGGTDVGDFNNFKFTSGGATFTPTPSGGTPGDANGDDSVNIADYAIWLNNYSLSRQGSQYGDFNGNGRVEGIDYVIWMKNYTGAVSTPTQTTAPTKTPTPSATSTPPPGGVLRVPQDYSTIEVAYTAASHGNTILVAPGTYNNVCLSGGKSKRIAIRAQYPATTSPTNQQSILNSGCSHVIQFTTPLDNDGVFQQGEVVEFIGFVLNGSDDGFSYERASGIVKDNIISGQSDDPIDVDGPSEARIIGNILKDGTGGGDGIENRLHGFSSSRILLMIFRNNIIYKSRKDGIQLIDQTTSLTKRKYLIANNLIINSGQAGLGTTKGGDSNQANWPGGYALPEKIYVLHNTFVNNGMGGILGGANMKVHNNIFYNNSNVDLKNVSGSSIATHNLFFGPAADHQGSNVQSPNVTADPKFSNTGLPPNFSSYQLGSGSPAIDAGKVVNSYYQEFGVTPPGYNSSAPDLGWKEF